MRKDIYMYFDQRDSGELKIEWGKATSRHVDKVHKTMRLVTVKAISSFSTEKYTDLVL